MLLTPFQRLTPNKLVHRVLTDACLTILDGIALLIADYVTVDSQCDSRITVAHLLLLRGCAVCEKGTRCAVTSCMEPAAWNAQLLRQGMKLFRSQLVC
jgi:hypothetical protein